MPLKQKNMKTKEFEVKIYYSSYCTYLVKADNETKAINKARKLEINNDEILSNLENWKEADTGEAVKS